MLINFQSVFNKEITFSDLAEQYSNADLREALNSYVDFTVQIFNDISDEQALYVPNDPHADDPYAVSEEDHHVGWNLVHLVMHVTASAEEAASFSSILARGIEIGGRLRTERDWRRVTTCADTVARLEECRRICLAYLGTWPDQPDLDTRRIMPEHISWMKPNAPTQFLAGLLHWHAHVEQFQKVAEQARAFASHPVAEVI